MSGGTIGSWRFDNERTAMLHALTGQSVRLIGRAAPEPTVAFTNSGNRIWLRFEYEDRETSYPLLVEWRNVPGYGRPLTWRVDHDRSARLWRLMRNVEAQHPPYGLWRRVDDCVIDAFSCWPSNASSGRYPTCVAINAGWLNGQWAPALYRATWCRGPARVPVALDLDVPVIPPLDAPAPAPWIYSVPRTSDGRPALDPASWEHEPLRIARDLQALSKAAPHLTTADGTRFLIGMPRDMWSDPKAQERPPVYRSRLLYADRDVVTDILMADIGASGPNPLEWTIGRTSGLVIGLRDGEGKPIPQIRTSYAVPDSLQISAKRVPNWLALKLAHTMIDARLSHPNLGVDFAGRSVEADCAVRADEPATLAVTIPDYATDDKRLYASTSLHAAREGAPNPLTSSCFDEENDGIVRATAPVATTGCWLYDPETRNLINRETSQRLRLIASPENDKQTPALAGGQSWRFQYSDADTDYPVVVRSVMDTRPWGYGYVWHVDHAASSQLWREQHNGPATPPYGLWRRVDSCALDAFLCWPEIEVTGPAPNSVEARAGWIHGAWNDNLQRTIYRGQSSGFDPPDGQYERPFVERLDAVAPIWRFVDAPHMAGRADIAGIQEASAGQYYLPYDSPLAGFQSSMPHLLRSDGKAVIFPAGCSGPDRKHGFADAWFMYADEDAFFFVAGSARTFGWHIYLARAESPACAGLRHRERFDPRQSGGLPADLFVQRTSRHSFGSIASLTRNPSPGLAHRITTSLLDAGLLWNRETGHVCEVPDRLLRQHPRAYGDPKDWQSVKIEKGNTIGVEGGYIGGLFNATLSIRATISKT